MQKLKLKPTNGSSSFPRNLSIWSLNIEGFTVEKLGELTHLMKQQNPHIVLLQETWLKENRLSDVEINIPDYSFF